MQKLTETVNKGSNIQTKNSEKKYVITFTVKTWGSYPAAKKLSMHTYCKIYKLNSSYWRFNPLNPELNPICYLLALLAHHFLHVSRIRVKSLTIRLLMSYIYIYIWSTYS